MTSAVQTDASPAKARNAYIDTLRGVAIFGVACIHFGGSFVNPGNAWSPSFYLGLVTGQLFNFAVPLFIFLSGVLAGLSSARPSLGAYYRGRLVRIGLPYLAASLVSFFVLNHYGPWQALPGVRAQLGWIAEHLFYLGVEPTLYFVPLIIQLYLLQPLLQALPGWIQRATGGTVRLETIVLVLTLLFLVLHVVLGVLCDRGTLSYYYWCRPCPLFWLCYFFAGLHFKALSSLVSRRGIGILVTVAAVAAAWAMVADFGYLTDRSQVGANFEFNHMDWAYSRPCLMVFDLAMVGLLSAGIALGWNCRASLVSFLGPYTLEIYLWHILLLYEGAWRHAEALESCRQMPEVILFIAAAVCLVLAGAKYTWTNGVALIRQYRLILVRDPW